MRRSAATLLLLLLPLAGVLAQAGCGGGGAAGPQAPQSREEVEAVLAELESLTAELTKKIEGAPDRVAGVRQAQELLDARGAGLRPKVSSLKKSRSFREDEETRKRVLASEVESVVGLRTRFMAEAANNRDFHEKLNALLDDYEKLFRE
jgi:hypothetical protein